MGYSPCFAHCLLSCSVVFDSMGPHGLWPARPFSLWNFPGKNTGAGYFEIGANILACVQILKEPKHLEVLEEKQNSYGGKSRLKKCRCLIDLSVTLGGKKGRNNQKPLVEN